MRPDVIYVLRALGLGDLLTAVPALRGLRKHFSAARIVLAVPAALRELAMLTGAVDEVAPTAALGDLSWTDTAPALGVNLHGRGPQSIEHLLSVGARDLLSHRHPEYPESPGPQWRDDVHEVDRWCGLLEWAGITCAADDLQLERPGGYPRRRGGVMIHPGAAAPARRWPADRFAAVAASLRDDGHDVVVTGSADEHALATDVAQRAGLPDSSVLAGSLSLVELLTLVADSRLVVCGDTGVGHLATAVSTPSVLLFGPTPPSLWGPRAGRHLVLWAGGTGNPHADTPHAGLLALSTDQVLNASRTVLQDCA
jgi:ADP-heptose:LPS heptosyltransferase